MALRYTTSTNYIAVNFISTGMVMYDVSAGVGTGLCSTGLAGDNDSIPLTTPVTITMSGRNIVWDDGLVAVTCTLPTGSANITATNVGFAKFSGSLPLTFTSIGG